jgi:hypothetical protein
MSCLPELIAANALVAEEYALPEVGPELVTPAVNLGQAKRAVRGRKIQPAAQYMDVVPNDPVDDIGTDAQAPISPAAVEVSDADFGAALGLAVQAHGQPAVVDILKRYTSNQSWRSVPGSARAQAIADMKALG